MATVNTELIKTLAKDKGMSIAQLEKNANVGNGAIGKWNASTDPNLSSLRKIAECLDCSVSDLIKEEE